MLTALQVLEHVRGSTGPEVEKEFLEVIIYRHFALEEILTSAT
jgi:hypothetical protein